MVTEKSRRKRVVANQEGRIWQRASDGRFAARVYPPGGGKVRHVYGISREDVKTRRDNLLRDLADSMPGGRDKSLGEYFEHWLTRTLPQRVKAGKLAQSTLDSYRSNAELHILRELGRIPMGQLTAPRLREWQQDLRKKRSSRPRRKLRAGEKRLPPAPLLSARTVAYCQAILNKALADAVRDKSWGLKENPLNGVDAPDDTPPEMDAPSYEEAEALLNASREDRLWCYWHIVLALGLRRGEALGLRWADIDFERKTVTIRRSIQRGHDEHGVSGLREKKLKTRASAATVAAGDILLGSLRTHQREQRAERLRSRVWHDEADLVFTTSIGTALEPRNVNRAWLGVCAAAGTRRIRIHDLRHAWGTWLANEGTPQKVIMSGLRHSKMSTTEIYVHAMEEPNRAAAERMDAIVGGLLPASRRSS